MTVINKKKKTSYNTFFPRRSTNKLIDAKEMMDFKVSKNLQSQGMTYS